jgi:hypothetical protein
MTDEDLFRMRWAAQLRERFGLDDMVPDEVVIELTGDTLAAAAIAFRLRWRDFVDAVWVTLMTPVGWLRRRRILKQIAREQRARDTKWRW